MAGQKTVDKTVDRIREQKAAGKKTTLTGARILWECLEREGVKQVFGYPGGAILPVYDALRHSSIHHILVRHEPVSYTHLTLPTILRV